MKIIQKNWYIFIVFGICFTQDVLTLTKRYFHTEDMGHIYERGTYLVILADYSLESILRDEDYGNFIHFKETQGYNVIIEDMDYIGESSDNLRNYLKYYYEQVDNMLEYVLLVGDVDGNFPIPSGSIRSYNEDEMDVTDYPYTVYDSDRLSPLFYIGRWSIRSIDDLKRISLRTVQYVKMDNLQNSSYLNNALVVAGNYSDSEIIPITPIWTSNWLKDKLFHYGMESVDTAYYYNANNQQSTSNISTVWNSGVSIINYRGWGDSKGWKYPYFDRDNIEDLSNGWYLPVVMSFVCNTGDFGNDGVDKCFGEKLITSGSINNPKGAVAMIGPSDLDTDTRFNNVMCAVMWDELLEGRIMELGPALHAGKQAISTEFEGLEINNTDIAEFYHHVYGVLGDPSLPVWLGEPNNMTADINEGQQLISSHISTVITNVTDVPLMDVVGALLYDNELIAKGLSNAYGELVIDFENVPDNSILELYLNKAQYYQKKIFLNYESDDGNTVQMPDYHLPVKETDYVYIAIDSNSEEENAPKFDPKTISEIGENLLLVDDTLTTQKNIGFNFQYYGETFDKLTVCSNGWASFLPCLGNNENGSDCNSIPYFFNNSIPHPLGPYGMLAPFFDDLDDNEGIEPFNVYFWTNEADSVIVEWNNIANGQHDEDCVSGEPDSCPRHTFQLILVGSDGANGEIIFQYFNVSNWKDIIENPSELWYVDDHGSTIGIESPDKNTGTQYLFNLSDEDAPLLHNGLAVKFYDGNSADLGINHNIIPQHFILSSYPNPFNPVITISLTVPEMGLAVVDVFDIQGRKLTNLANGNYQPGYYSLIWDASAFSSGVYFITLIASDTRLTQKVLLLK